MASRVRRKPKSKEDAPEGLSEVLIQQVANKSYDEPIDEEKIESKIKSKEEVKKIESKTVVQGANKSTIYLDDDTFAKVHSMILKNKINKSGLRSLNSIVVHALKEYLDEFE